MSEWLSFSCLIYFCVLSAHSNNLLCLEGLRSSNLAFSISAEETYSLMYNQPIQLNFKIIDSRGSTIKQSASLLNSRQKWSSGPYVSMGSIFHFAIPYSIQNQYSRVETPAKVFLGNGFKLIEILVSILYFWMSPKSRDLELAKDENKIRELPSGNPSKNLKSKIKKVSSWITENSLLTEFDSFQTEVKFLVNGEESHSTVFGGIVGLMIVVSVILITYVNVWPEEFSSRIQISKRTKDIQSGTSICDHVQFPMSVSFHDSQTGQTNVVPSDFSIKAYSKTKMDINSETTVTQIPVSRNCKQGEIFCLNCAQLSSFFDQNDRVGEITGGTNHLGFPETNITFEILWCNPYIDFSCPIQFHYYFDFKFQLVKKLKGKQLGIQEHVKKELYFPFYPGMVASRILKVDSEQYISNNKFLGHLANLFPYSTMMYSYKNDLIRNPSRTFERNSQSSPTSLLLARMDLVSSGFEFTYQQIFEDVTMLVVFFLAVIDPLRIIITVVLIRCYNKNSKNLYIANQIYYAEDPKNDEKYDFQSGSAVFFTCLIYGHPLTNLVKKMLSCCGQNLVDVLPEKCIYTIAMINEGEKLLRQDYFFRSLEGLLVMDNLQAKKIPFVAEEEEDEDQQPLHYFHDDALRRQAFVRFCRDNEYYSNRRKNRMYQMLVDKKYSTRLRMIAHQTFDTYVRNVENLKAKGKFLETVYDEHLPVEVVNKGAEESLGNSQLSETNVKMYGLREDPHKQ